MSRWSFARAIAVALVMLFAADAERAWALKVEEVRWGFDGTAPQNRFGMLSIQFSNPSEREFDGTLTLRRNAGPGSSVGDVLVEKLFVGPFGLQSVQFFPYNAGGTDEWTLSWGRGADERHRIQGPDAGHPAVVLLRDPSDVTRRSGALREFDESLFPPFETATDGLEAAFLDHVPSWNYPRPQALVDWLKLGGVLHLLQDPSGKHPEFSDTLAILNSPLDEFRVGSGYVIKHPLTAAALDRAKAADLVELGRTKVLAALPVDSPSNPDSTSAEQDPLEAASADYSYGGYQGYDSYYQYGDLATRIFSTLRLMTQPDHNWALIHGMSWIYFLLLFPGCYLLGRSRLDYRLTFGAILLTVAVFSGMFLVIGQRGYGETTTVNQVAIARPLDDGRYDVTCWSNVFVTSGDDYDLKHVAEGTLYTTAQENERVNGRIVNGAEAQFFVDIPPFSSRSLVWRGLVKADPFAVTVERWEPSQEQDAPPSIALNLGDGFPMEPVAFAVYKDTFYRMGREGDRLTLAGRIGNVNEFGQHMTQLSGNMYGYNYQSNNNTADAIYPQFAQVLGTYALGEPLQKVLNLTSVQRESSDVNQFKLSLPQDRLRVFAYGPMPEAFFVANDLLGKQQGRVLYCFDVFEPESL